MDGEGVWRDVYTGHISHLLPGGGGDPKSSGCAHTTANATDGAVLTHDCKAASACALCRLPDGSGPAWLTLKGLPDSLVAWFDRSFYAYGTRNGMPLFWSGKIIWRANKFVKPILLTFQGGPAQHGSLRV